MNRFIYHICFAWLANFTYKSQAFDKITLLFIANKMIEKFLLSFLISYCHAAGKNATDDKSKPNIKPFVVARPVPIALRPLPMIQIPTKLDSNHTYRDLPNQFTLPRFALDQPCRTAPPINLITYKNGKKTNTNKGIFSLYSKQDPVRAPIVRVQQL